MAAWLKHASRTRTPIACRALHDAMRGAPACRARPPLRGMLVDEIKASAAVDLCFLRDDPKQALDVVVDVLGGLWPAWASAAHGVQRERTDG